MDYSLFMILKSPDLLVDHAIGSAMAMGMEQPGGFIDTEILSMDLSGANPLGPPFPLLIRQSPTLPPLGMAGGGGSFPIDSFFDIFTELSLDGGSNWSPVMDQEGTHFALLVEPTPPQIPEPATVLLVGTGFAVMARSVRRRRNRKA